MMKALVEMEMHAKPPKGSKSWHCLLPRASRFEQSSSTSYILLVYNVSFCVHSYDFITES